ncbi:MAG: alkaline phosphatase family protein, partial [Flavobacteriales bacterium]|nr:alkaline phosphatase family protein [Flavobacteriales bacterium]
MKRLFIFSLVIIPFLSIAQRQKPKLVVGIVIDQMRYDYLTRFWDKYSNDGFKKLVNEGFNCKNANYNYMPTYTGPGHASIYTGTTPENHGIISNTWYNKIANNNMYCTQDYLANTIGSNTFNGKMSPKNMLSTTITDELKLATKNRGKVIGISIKDRGAILPAGHKADAAYWYDGGDVGKWISSTFYMNELPKWVKKVNKINNSDKYLNTKWETLLSIDKYTESIADNNPYEGTFNGEKAPIFPHNLPALRDSNHNYSLIKSTPFGNTILKELALAAIEGENLGKDEFTDFLAISFSSPDYIGHKYGPMSIEIEDTYLRLDKDLAEIITYLEKNFGKDEILIFLTADHGAVNVPQYLIDNNLPAGYFDNSKLKTDLKSYLKKEYNTDTLIMNISNYQIFLNHVYINKNNWNIESIENAIARFLLTQKGIAKAVTATSLKSTEFNNRILANTQRGFHQARSGDILYVLESGWIPAGYPTGTTHGSPYNYDTHVPLLWYGTGVKKGNTNDFIVIPDIAATIAALLDIQP